VGAFDSDVERGLAAEEAARRLAHAGANELRRTPPRAAWHKFLDQFRAPLVILLLLAVVTTLIVWVVEGMTGWPIDALVIAAIVVVNAILGHVQEARSENAAAALARMTSVMCSVIRDGQILRIPSAGLVCGDLLPLAEGDAVGADARLLKSAALRIQEAALTGESESVLKDTAVLTASAALGDRHNMVFKGTAVAQGSGLAVVTATGMDTQMGLIADLLEATKMEITPLQREVARIGRMLGIAVLVIAALVVTTILLVAKIHSSQDLVAVLLLGVSLAVAAVPEGLPVILSVVLAIGVQRMARRNAVVKNLSSVETLGSATVICTDKTGTLTRSEMTIERIMTFSGESHVTGVGYVPEGRVEHCGEPLADGPLHAEHVVMLSGGSLAGNAGLLWCKNSQTWQVRGDPTEAAFLVAERKLGVHERRGQRFERLREIPFTADRKMMSSIEIDHEHDDQIILISKGAPDMLLERCTRARVGLTVVALDDTLRGRALAAIESMSDAALRTLAVAYRPLDVTENPDATETALEALEHDLIFVGTVGMIDSPRPEVAGAIGEAQRAGIRVVMITGDHPHTAARIASDLGIVSNGTEASVLSGTAIDALDDTAFAAAVCSTAIYARVTPAHKLRIVAALQAAGNIVAMTGDGVNDAPALKAADIGIAMGITGTEVARQAARMILADDNFVSIVAAVREGRVILDNIRKFLRYLLSSNMGEVLTVFLGVIGAGVLGLADEGGGLILPLLATQLLWINLLTDAAPALAMGIDPQIEDVMARRPRRLDEPIIDARMWSNVLQTGLVMALTTLLTIDAYLPGGLIQGHGDLVTARSAGFTVLVFAQIFNCFSTRSATVSAFYQPFENRWLWGAVGISALLQVAVVHVDFLNTAFATAPLTPEQWLVCLAMSSTVLWTSELRKLWLRCRITTYFKSI